ncbi:MAG TPA: hypothetical protein VGD80_35685 [Kofleriaceae bacterium]
MRLASLAVIVALSVVSALVSALAVSASAGCSREARPAAQPGEQAPLPPSAGTPIGHLVDNAAELTLSDDQLRKLRTINDDLAAQLAGDDSELHPVRVAPPEQEKTGRGLGFRATGRTSEGAGGGVGGFPNNSSAGNQPDGSTSREILVPASTVNYVYQQRARHVRDAIHRALDLLDAEQQTIARRLLTDHGVNLDTGETGADPAAAMDPPKPNQPLPRTP